MNFIGHYLVSPYKEEAWTVFGTLLPDLYRGFSKDYNKLPENLKKSNDSFQKGIRFHIETDHVFHNHHFFVKKNKELTRAIQEEHLAKKHTYIIAHVLFELLLDQYIINKQPEIIPSFYNTLSKIEDKKLEEKLHLYFDNAKANKIICIFKSFKDNKYAFHLKSAEGIADSLQYIIGNKMGIQFDANLWAPFIAYHIKNYNELFEGFIINLKSKLYNA